MEVTTGVLAVSIFIMFVVMLVGERFLSALIAVIELVWSVLSE